MTVALVAGLILNASVVSAADAKAPAKGFLGVAVASTPDDAKPNGAVVKDVTPDSPAAKAGLKVGDVILGLDKTEVASPQALVEAVGSHKAGDKLQVRFIRDGKEHKLDVTLAERQERKLPFRMDPKELQEKFGFRPRAFLGVMPSELTPELKKQLNLNLDKGVVVQEVIPDSPAASMGVQAFDVIVELNQKAVNTPDELRKAIQETKADQEVTLKVLRGKETKELKGKLNTMPGGFGLLREWDKDGLLKQEWFGDLDRDLPKELKQKLDEMRKHFEKFEPKE